MWIATSSSNAAALMNSTLGFAASSCIPSPILTPAESVWFQQDRVRGSRLRSIWTSARGPHLEPDRNTPAKRLPPPPVLPRGAPPPRLARREPYGARATAPRHEPRIPAAGEAGTPVLWLAPQQGRGTRGRHPS